MGTIILGTVGVLFVLAIFGIKPVLGLIFKVGVGCIWFLTVAAMVFLLLEAVDPVR